MKIKFCKNNKGKTKVINKLKENYSDVEISVKKCIGECHACSNSPIAKIDHKVVSGKDTKDLYNKIVKIIDKK